MRKSIREEDYKGQYTEEIKPEDLLIMGKRPEDPLGMMPLNAGIYEGLWQLSLETGLGLLVDMRKIPLDQSEIDRCNKEDINPYDRPMNKEIYIVHSDPSYFFTDDLTVIGYMTEEKVCKIKNRDRISYLKS
ncbi:MAG: hypothetical protein K6G03_04505 [Lachnospiraceae bacterium]|nr:hypothetical protein [Lachnospiraceae bacterium]